MSETTEVNLSAEATAFAEWFLRYRVPPTELEVNRALVEANHRMATEPENVTYRDIDAGGVPAIWCEPIGADTRFVLLHGHNGGTVVGSAAMDRKTAGHIAAAIGIPSLVVDFRLAPENKYPAQIDDFESAVTWLVDQGYAPDCIVTIGHSVGGYLAAALAIRLRDAGKPTPLAVVSISPWADLSINNETMRTNAEKDLLLSKELLEFFREAWIGGTDVASDDVRINLIHSDLGGLPPILVSWGTYEVLAGEDQIFADRLRSAGVDVSELPVAGLQHSYVVGAGRVPEADRAIKQIAEWVREKVGIRR
ncbi:alpha/beta hydrolase [Herbiconiux ginsengi]|uniref:Acetyl esterase/lipase n=1 Tax=Herbiconiux ginsengi TaxID=381665 RepID=A0A1H3TCG8_9MICO|nr:alpha/beta hydrolase [Herbiconiux ginsengi]SDZ47647.1 Acetyl esterase/lipase [Herbiconiux ginsengi]